MADTEIKVAATGRRKESVVRVRVTAGTAEETDAFLTAMGQVPHGA